MARQGAGVIAELTAEQFQRVEMLYFGAHELKPSEWEAFLESRCGDDAVVRDEVRSLLEHARHVPTLRPLHSIAALEPDAWIGKSIGPYHIAERLGQGGMGVVFRAEQTRPVRRTVAIKLIRPGMDSPEVIARFESERQALAMMSHANVARVFDAGATDDGRHYFVMEFVPGEPITSYCDKHRLSTQERLDLFMQVCDAVQHAHQKGIIHRDLKPSNVLITLESANPLPKVIDFGIAKAVEQSLTGMTGVTQMNQPIGTPEYMSPEQASAGGLDIDTRTDVYSLGVLLYELLAGALPFASDTWQKTTFDEIRRIIREVDPPIPSSRLSAIGETIHTIANQRQAAAGELVRTLRGDLDWITMKALEKDRARRYGSAADLAADVKRYLDYEPVSAGPPSAGYRVRKFVRRHRVPVAAAGLLALALVGGIVATTWQFLRARRAEALAVVQKARAEQRFKDVRKLAGAFMFDVDETLQTAGPTKARQKLVNTSIEFLDKIAAEGNETDPTLLSELCKGYMRVGSVQYYPGLASLGDPRGALRSYQKALDAAQRRLTLQPDSFVARSDMAASWDCIAEANFGLGDAPASLAAFENALRIYQQLAAEKPDDLKSRRNVALELGKIGDTHRRARALDEAAEYLDKAQTIREALYAKNPDDAMLRRDVALGHNVIATVQRDRGLYDRALASFQKSADEHRAMLQKSPDNPVYQRDVSRVLDQITNTHLMIGNTAAAVAAARECLEFRQRAASSDPGNARALQDLGDGYKIVGDTLAISGKTSESIENYQKSLEIRRKLVEGAPDNPDFLGAMATSFVAIGEMQRVAGEYDGASASCRSGAETYEKLLAKDPDDVVNRKNLALAYASIGECLAKTGKPDEAMQMMSRAIEVHEAGTRGKDRPAAATRGLASLHTRKARLLHELHRDEEALRAYRRATQIARELAKLDANDKRAAAEVLESLLDAGTVLLATAPDEAAAPLAEAMAMTQAQLAAEPASIGAHDWWRQIHVALGELDARAGRTDSAIAHVQTAIAAAEKILAIDSSRVVTKQELEKHRSRLNELTSTTRPASR